MYKIEDKNGMIDFELTKSYFDYFENLPIGMHKKMEEERIYTEIRLDLTFEIEQFLENHKDNENVKNICKYIEFCKKFPENKESDEFLDLEELYIESVHKIFSKSAKWNAGLIEGAQSLLFDAVESFIINN